MQLLGLQKYAAKDYNGLVTTKHLGSLFQKKPLVVDNVINEIYKTNLQNDMVSFVNRFPIMEVEENNYYEWMLQGQHDKNIPLIEAYDENGDAPGTGNFLEPGKNISRFYMLFPEQYFEVGNVIVGHKEPYHLYITKVSPKGSNFEYQVELITYDKDLFVPPTELASGTRWSKDYNLVSSTLSSKGAKPNFTSPYRMRNTISQMRMEYTVPGNMIGQGKNYALEFPFMVNGKKESVWINYQDMVADLQFRQQYARMLLYGKRNFTADDLVFNKDENSKFEVTSGSGLFEQIDPSNIYYYNDFDIDWMVGVFLDMGVGRIERGKRMITLGTGEFGALQFHLAVQNNSTKWTPNFYQDRIYKTDAGGIGAKMGLGYGGQFLEYTSVNGVGIRLEIIPFFDDIVRFKDYHPSGQGTTESYRYIAFDYGGEAGIHRVRPKGQSPVFRYINGMRDAFSPGGTGAPQVMSSAIDGYEVHRMDWGGMMVKDPTKIVDFRFNQL